MNDPCKKPPPLDGKRLSSISWEAAALCLTALALSRAFSVAAGVLDGSTMHQALECTTLAALSLILRSARLGRITTEQFIALLLCVWRVRFGVVTSCGFLLGATDLLTDVVTFPIGVISTEATVLHLQLRHMVDCGDWPKRVKTLCVSLAAPVLALFWRALHDPEAEQLAKVLALVTLLTVCIVSAMCWSVSEQYNLKREKEAALKELQSAYLTLNEIKSGLARMLNAACDAVVEADSRLRFRCSSWALHDLVGSADDDPTSLNGREIFDFLPTEEAVERARMCLLGCPGGRLCRVPSDHDGQAVSAAPAAVFTTEMQSAGGMRFTVDVYHVQISSSPRCEPSFLLGLRVKDRGAEELFFPPAPEVDAARQWVAERAAEGAEPPTNITGTKLCECTQSVAGSDALLPTEDSTSIALPFDAGSEAFVVYRRSMFASNLKKKSHTGLLRWVHGEHQTKVFEQWVIDEVNRHTAAEAEGECFKPTPFPGELTLKLPACGSRFVRARSAVLEINPQESVQDLPVTLHISGLNAIRHAVTLETVDDETGTSSEDITWSDSASAAW